MDCAAGPLLPALIFTIIITQLPFLATHGTSPSGAGTTRTTRTSDGLAGFDNYEQGVHQDKTDAVKDIWHTVELTVTVVVLVSLVLRPLHRPCCSTASSPGRGAVRTMMIAPFLIVPVAAALFFKLRHVRRTEHRPAQRRR